MLLGDGKNVCIMRDFRLPPLRKWELRSSGSLHNE